jgi:phosphate transport system ATP-binding protein
MSSERKTVAEPAASPAIPAVNLRQPVSERAEHASEAVTVDEMAIRVERLSAYYGTFKAIEDVTLDFHRHNVTAIIGPSGCGKSTLLRCLNRMHEIIPNARVEGVVMMDGQNTYAPETNAVLLRRKVGMVFQKPNPFPTRSIYDTVAAGLKLAGRVPKQYLDAVVERSLLQAALWNEVKDKLHQSAFNLSGGQQQRLCIARAIAVQPEVILMDEPASALDPISTLKIEDLMVELRADYTIIIVTHNLQQAARVSDRAAFMLGGEDRIGHLIEYAPTREMFTAPQDDRTEQYITGRFG